MKRTFKSLLAAAALAFIGLGSLLAASPAKAQTPATCTAVTGTGYPYLGTDGNAYAFVCFADPNNHKAEVFNAIKALPDPVKLKLQNQGARFFFFATRSEANIWFNRPYTAADPNPYASAPNGVFASTTARCGNTGFTIFPGTQLIATAVYDQCTTDTNVPAQTYDNPSRQRTATHEAGHAFDFAIGTSKAINRTISPSTSTGFSTIRQWDLNNNLTPNNPNNPNDLYNWTKKTQAQKWSYVCAVFGTGGLSNLELDLGGIAAGGPQGQVCQNPSTPYGPFQSLTPKDIAIAKLPYFVNDGKELWAENFTITKLGSSTISTFLQMTDKTLGANQPNKRQFDCSRFVVETYYNSGGIAPTSAQLTARGCPSVTFD